MSVKDDVFNNAHSKYTIEELKQYKQIICKCNSYWGQRLPSDFPQELLGDKAFMLDVCKDESSLGSFAFAADNLKNDRDFVLEIINYYSEYNPIAKYLNEKGSNICYLFLLYYL